MKKILWLVLLVSIFINAVPVELSDNNYKDKLKEHKRSILMFSASWCGACQSMKATYRKFAFENQKNILVSIVDTDENRDITSQYNIQSLPTLILLEEGKELKRTVGSLEMDELNLFVHTEKVLKNYVEKCQNGNSNVCLEVGEFYEEGMLVKRDYIKALKFYEQSCTLQNAEGCMYLGYMYDEALGVKQDYVTAIKYYTQGCDGGNIIGCRFLGYLYDEGLGIKQDYKKAHDLYTKACDGEDEYACNNLGYMYSKGNGLNKSLAKALSFYKLACEYGYDEACDKVDELSNK